MADSDFNNAAKFPFVPGRPDINEGIDVLESRGFVLDSAEFKPGRASNVHFIEPGTDRIAMIMYDGSFDEPLVLIGKPGTIDPEIVVSLKQFVATKGAAAAPKPALEGPQP